MYAKTAVARACTGYNAVFFLCSQKKLQHLPFFAENTIQNHADFSPRSIPKNGMARRNTTAENHGIESLLSALSRELGNGGLLQQ